MADQFVAFQEREVDKYFDACGEALRKSFLRYRH